MKIIEKLKLNQLHKDELSEREMNFLNGGGPPGNCVCGCGGPSSTSHNMGANSKEGFTTSIGTGDGDDACTCLGADAKAAYKSPTEGTGCTCGCYTLTSTASTTSGNSGNTPVS